MLRSLARLPVIALGVAVCGVVLRMVYALWAHHPRNHVSSDAYEYVALAHRLLDAPEAQTLRDTIWPPGTSSIWALMYSLDPSLNAIAIANVIASVLVMWLTASSARLVAGPRAGWFALIFASLHLGFIHYAGFTLAEQFFQLTAALAVWSSLLSLSTLSLSPQRSTTWRAVSGLATGLAWGLAALFRPNALPVLLVAALALAWHWFRRRERAAIPLVVGVVLGLLLVLGPASDRCTRNAGGHFCLVSNNIAMNMAMGQAGTYYGLEFRDPKTPENASSWVPPALLHHGYTGLGKLPATIYDTRGVLSWWFDRLLDDPSMFVTRAIGNGFDLFDLHYWPDNYDALGTRTALVWKQIFFTLVLLPGLVGLYRLLRVAIGASKPPTERPITQAIFFISASAGLFLSAALSLGEARYRLPFDILLLVAASMVYAKADLCGLSEERWRWLARSTVIAATVSGVGAAVVLSIAHPRIAFGKHLPQDSDAPGVLSARHSRSLASMSRTRRDGTPWNERGNHVFDCSARCRELVVKLDRLEQAARVNLSIDHNDRYRLFFYRQQSLVGHVDVRPPAGKLGLRNTMVQVPVPARAGFDAIGVAPLYGDGRYSLGHLRLVSEPNRKRIKKTTDPR